MAGLRESVGGFDRAAAQARTRAEDAERGAAAAEHALEGRWRVDYDDPWFTGSLVYDLRERADGLEGHLVEIRAGGGAQFLPEGPLVFELGAWDGTEGTGRYYMEYEGVAYEAECDIALLSPDRLRVRYSYYGERGEEIWERIGDGDR